MRRGQLGVALFTTLLLGSGAAWAQRPDAQMYELIETANLIAGGAAGTETSVTAMTGFVVSGTPLCPAQFAAQAGGQGQNNDVRDNGPVCAVNIIGSSALDLATGVGSIKGDFQVVLPDPINPKAVDASELVVVKGTFTGTMDFSPAVKHGTPYGTVSGVLTTDSGVRVAYTGIFVMPFDALCAMDDGQPITADCYLTYTLSGYPPTATVTGMTRVARTQKAIGYPTPRFDIYFRK